MNFIRMIYDMTKKRIKETPLTSLFLITGLVMSLLIISVAVNFVPEYMEKQNERENVELPRAVKYMLTFTAEEEKHENIENLFKGIRKETGVIIDNILLHIDEEDGNTYSETRIEYFLSNGGWHYPVSQGRCYTEAEVVHGEKVALIGKKYKEYAYKEDKHYYINIENEKYRVLGIVDGGEEHCEWNSRIYMPCTVLPKSVADEYIKQGNISFALYNNDGDFETDEKQIKENAKNMFGEYNISYFGETQREKRVEKEGQGKGIIFIIAIIISLAVFAYSVSISIFWNKKTKRDLTAGTLSKYKSRDIRKLLFAEKMGLTLISCMVAVVLQVVINVFTDTIAGYPIEIYWYNIVMEMVLMLAVSGIMSVFNGKKRI